MLRVTPIVFTERTEEWSDLLQALGMVLAVREEGWWEFDSHSGGVRLHAPDHAHPIGTFRMAFEVGDVDEFIRRTRQEGAEVVVTEEKHGRTANIVNYDGLPLVATAEQRAPSPGDADPDLHVVALWCSAVPPDAAQSLRAMGAEVTEDQAGEWILLRAKNGGFVATRTHTRPDASLAFRYDGDLDALTTRLAEAGLDAVPVDDPLGRVIRLAHPDEQPDVKIFGR